LYPRKPRGYDELDYWHEIGGHVPALGGITSHEDLSLTEEEAKKKLEALARKRPPGFTATWPEDNPPKENTE
jgi:hypothetical protein